ncbi:MAG: undecaprenyl/decaprenyl-phosphate alpha-N-acetylglucosaminyl 1-phosphate transferase [Planctomycetes bacterium]|nr:undecaprenyl/decaprenyl-phosphate alpha-N-acetylglucosaminyl 1-phosphate transferase [Planctomycetota bacterium]
MPSELAIVLGGAFGGAAICTALIVPLVIRLANSQGWLDRPGGRHVHAVPVPRIGGLAIFLGLLIGSLCFAGLAGWDKLLAAFTARDLRGFLAPCVLVFLIGLLDDIRGTSPYVRLFVEAIAAATLIQAGYVLEQIATPWGPVSLGPLAFPVTLAWIVGITNAYNLIDGLDGLLATCGAAALIGCAAVGLASGMVGTPALALALAGALCGFLYFNWHPAKIFLGDSGSLLIGFTVAAWSLKVTVNPNQTHALHTMLLISGLPIAETLLTLARRYVGGQPFFVGDQSHIHHVLLKKGLGVPKTVRLLALVSFGFAGAAFFSRFWREGSALVSVVVLVGAGGFALRYLRYLEFNLILDRLLQALRKSRRGLPGVLALVRAGDRVREAKDAGDLCDALADVLQGCRLTLIAYEPTPVARRKLATEPRIEANNSAARALTATCGDDLLWLLSAEKDPDPTQPQIELVFPLPSQDGRLGRLLVRATHDPDAPLPSAQDLHRYLATPLATILEHLCAGASDDADAPPA